VHTFECISKTSKVIISYKHCDDDVTETVHELVIVRLSLTSGSVNGGDDMIILCEKVKKGEQTCIYFKILSYLL